MRCRETTLGFGVPLDSKVSSTTCETLGQPHPSGPQFSHCEKGSLTQSWRPFQFSLTYALSGPQFPFEVPFTSKVHEARSLNHRDPMRE